MRAKGILLLCAVTAITALDLGLAEDQWWQSRGPDGNGHSKSTDLPLKWDEKKHVVWKTPIHDRKFSSPVIWGDQIWMTTATKDGKKMFAVCVEKNSGEVVHDTHVFEVEAPMANDPGKHLCVPYSGD